MPLPDRFVIARAVAKQAALLLATVCVFLGATAAHAVLAQVTPAPSFRLGDAVKPLSYEVALTIVPREDRFSGHLRVDVELSQATTVIWINANRLDIHRAVVQAGPHSVNARAVVAGRDLVGLHLAQPLPAGRATIVLDYDSNFERSDSDGVFKVREGDDWYVFTQFEAIAARRAFPCFDEPGWKTPWKIELIVPAGDVAASNAPIASEQTLPGGMKRVRFKPTLPLPSYLVAFAVGPLEVVDGGGVGRNAAPLRYLVPRGRAAELRYAREVTPRLFETIEEYVGVPYPFEKIDIVAVPVSSGFGAMENAGLITIAADLMLAHPDEEGSRFRENYAGTAAHELAHQWFGDLVTMQWWDDLWLSESFADWQSERTLRHIDSGWQTRLSEDGERQGAIGADRLLGTRAIRAPVTSREQIDDTFDAISYQKGASLLRMLETWIGEDGFRNGVRRYLAAHAFGNARSSDLLAALLAEAGPQADDLNQVFTSMTEQVGVPALEIALDCGADGHGAPRLLLSQHRFVPLARQLAQESRPIPQTLEGQWAFPACFQYGEGADFGETCGVVRDVHQVLALPEGEKCPTWVVGNSRGNSYFLPILSAPLMNALLHAPLLPDEAVAVLGDARLLSQSGDMPLDLALELAARFADSRQPLVADAAVTLLQGVAPAVYASNEDREALARFVRTHFGERAARLGWTPKPDERVVDGLLRVDLLPLVADLGADNALRLDALRIAHSWLAGHVGLGDMLAPTLVTAAHYGNAELFDAYLAATTRVTGSDRTTLLTALGSFRDPVLIDRAIALASGDRMETRDARLVLLALAAEPASATQSLHYLEGHYDETMKRLGEDGSIWLSTAMARVCDANLRREFEHSFVERVDRSGIGVRDLAQALESSELCIGSRSEQGARLHAYLFAAPDRT